MLRDVVVAKCLGYLTGLNPAASQAVREPQTDDVAFWNTQPLREKRDEFEDGW